MEKPQKAEIWHVGGVGHDKASGQGGGEPPHVERGQGHVHVPQVPLIISREWHPLLAALKSMTDVLAYTVGNSGICYVAQARTTSTSDDLVISIVDRADAKWAEWNNGCTGEGSA